MALGNEEILLSCLHHGEWVWEVVSTAQEKAAGETQKTESQLTIGPREGGREGRDELSDRIKVVLFLQSRSFPEHKAHGRWWEGWGCGKYE